MMKLERKFKKENADIIKRIDESYVYIKDLQYKVEALTGKDTSLENLCFALLELARIDIALMEADESDRKSVSLIGVETAPQGNNSPGRQMANGLPTLP